MEGGLPSVTKLNSARKKPMQTTTTRFRLGAVALATGALALVNALEASDKGVFATPAVERPVIGATGDEISSMMYYARVPGAGGKTALEADPATGEALVPTLRYYLPANWNWGTGAANVDSYGNPIVNDALGWPAWAQRDVDALRDAIREAMTVDLSSPEGSGLLGNYVGQAIARHIDVSDILDLADATLITDVAAQQVIGRMHAYEQARNEESILRGIAYVPSTYSPAVEQFLAARGTTLTQVLAIDSGGNDGDFADRLTPSGCYFRVPSANVGLSILSGANVIWNAGGQDDEQADVPIGFPFYFYECSNSNINTAVRVSTNGYLTFFQQGGDALNGTAYLNEPIATASSPDGFVAGFWDDLAILNQGTFPDQASWKTEGALGYRVLTVEWFSVSRLGGSAGDYHTFQIQLHERRPDFVSQSAIVLAYGEAVTWWSPDVLDLATVGLEDFEGDDGECLSTCELLTNSPSVNQLFLPQANNVCANAIDIYDGTRFEGDLRYSYYDGSGGYNDRNDQWFTFHAPCQGTLTVTTCGSHDMGGVDQGTDTFLTAHSSCPGEAANMIGFNDDGGATCGDQGIVRDARLVLNLTAGQTVKIRVAEFAPTAVGRYSIQAAFAPSGPGPANDNCATAEIINAPASAAGNLFCASADGSSCFAGRDVWYSYAATVGGTLKVTTCGTNDLGGVDRGMDAVLSLHAGCPGNAGNMLACNDDASVCDDLGFEFDAYVTAAATAGQGILIRVSPLGGFPGIGEYQIQTYFQIADLNGNCGVDLADLATLLTHFGLQTGQGVAQGNLDFDGDVDLSDLATLLTHFGETCQ
jgi:hypothetical protein